MVFIAHFDDPADIGAKRAMLQLGECFRQLAVSRVAGEKIVAGQRRQQRRGVNQRPFRRAADARLYLLNKDRQHKHGGDGDNKKVAQ